MTAFLEGWSDFNVAVAGAGAALGGLLIVALSVNIRQIAESRGLAARAGASIATLILGVALSCAALIPGQVAWGYGLQVLGGTLVCGIVAVRSALAVRADARVTGYSRYDAERIAVFGLPLVFDLAGAVLLLALPASAVGLLMVAVATILAIVTTVLFSWVALVEVLR